MPPKGPGGTLGPGFGGDTKLGVGNRGKMGFPRLVGLPCLGGVQDRIGASSISPTLAGSFSKTHRFMHLLRRGILRVPGIPQNPYSEGLEGGIPLFRVQKGVKSGLRPKVAESS